jgi:hypothetical protein
MAEDFTAQDDAGRPFFVAPLVVVSDELGMEYPDKASALADSLDGFGVSRNQLLRCLASASTINRHIGSLAGITDEPPAVLLLGTPARRVTGNSRLAHITAWHFDDLGERIMNLLGEVQHYENDLTDEVRSIAEDWLGIADINWMVVYENRPEVTNRRDFGSAASWLIGKRVLVLGCGALGAPIAEQCVRAGVSSLTVADNGSVNPGILVRQPYTDADVGFNKALRLAKRLSTIRRDLRVQPISSNVISMFIGDDGPPPDFDLVIDATADVSVRAAVEAARARRRDEWPALVTGLFGHDAVRAIGILSRPGATGGAHDVLRRLAIDARGAAANNWGDIAEEFFPDPPRTDMFFPEPGCSAPTFTGSAIQTDALASALFWAMITELASEHALDPMVAFAIRLPGVATGTHNNRLAWPNDAVFGGVSGKYEVRVSTRALAEMRAEVRRGARVRGPKVETGGLLLGLFDEATRCVYVDTATGPSPDSALSTMSFSHGTAGTQEVVDHHRARTANRVGFVGMWHTHPYGPASPSPTDEAGMGWIVSPDGAGRRALLAILGGPEAKWEAWHSAGVVPDTYFRVVDRQEHGHAWSSRIVPQTATNGTCFPGGYYQPSSEPPLSRSWWQQVLGRRR